MNKTKVVLNWIWDQLKMPVIIFTVFLFGGFGFYHGVMAATDLGKVTMNTAIVISFLELRKDEEQAE